MKQRLNGCRTMCLFFKMFDMICITSHHTCNLQETLADQAPTAPTGTSKDCCGVRVFVVAQHQITPYISFTGDPCKRSRG